MEQVILSVYDGYATYGPTSEIEGDLLFGFDLDHTIIKPRSGTFYKNADEWEFVPGMEQKLKHLHSVYRGTLVIFTNQGGIEAGKTTLNEVTSRLFSVMQKIGFTFLVFIATSNRYRKPSPVMFEKLIYEYMPGFRDGFYIGDASSLDDFSDSDYRFALNTGLKYVDVGKFHCTGSLDDIINSCAQLQLRAQLPRINVRNYITPGAVLQYPDVYPNGVLTVLVGPPGCGKSTYAANARDWTTISRDTAAKGKHATAAQCLSAVRRVVKVMADKKEIIRIIVDATHPDIKSRASYIELARSMGLRTCAVVFDVPVIIANYINYVRCIAGGHYVPDVAYGMFAKRYKSPTVEEGFDQIITIRHIPQDYNAIPDEYFDLYI